jgi:hypothetical protein
MRHDPPAVPPCHSHTRHPRAPTTNHQAHHHIECNSVQRRARQRRPGAAASARRTASSAMRRARARAGAAGAGRAGPPPPTTTTPPRHATTTHTHATRATRRPRETENALPHHAPHAPRTTARCYAFAPDTDARAARRRTTPTTHHAPRAHMLLLYTQNLNSSHGARAH